MIRRLPLDAAAAVLLPVTVVLFAFGSSSVQGLVRIGGPGRWVALLALAGIAVARVVARRPRLESVPPAWVAAVTFVVLGVESALWSVDPRLTVGRIFTVGALFVAAGALALGSADARVAATRTILGVLAGIAVVAVASIALLVISRHQAVLAATEGAGWRFRGIGLNPNTVPMLLAVGMPIAVWRLLESSRRARWEGLALVLLFAGEIGFSGSRGALIAGFGGGVVTALLRAASPRQKLVVAGGLAVLGIACVPLSKLPNPRPLLAVPAPSKPVAKTRGVDAQQVFRLEDELGFPRGGSYVEPPPRTIFGSSGRAQAWDGALHQGAQRPIAGYGFGTENKVFVDRFFTFEGGFVENTYIGLFLQLGLAGVALFLGLLAALAWSGARLVRRYPRGESGPAAAALGVLAAAVLIGVSQTGVLAVGNIAASSIWICVLPLPLLAREARS